MITLCDSCHQFIEDQKKSDSRISILSIKSQAESYQHQKRVDEFIKEIESEDLSNIKIGKTDFLNYSVTAKRWKQFCNKHEYEDDRVPKLATQDYFAKRRRLIIHNLYLDHKTSEQIKEFTGFSRGMIAKEIKHTREELNMNKPTGFDEAQAMGDYTPAELGGHTAIIKGVKETQSKSGKPMVVICFDFDDKDKQPGYFMQAFKDDTRPDKKWPHAGTAYIMTQDYQDPNKTSRNFKTFCTCAENSNKFSIQWGDNWGAQFKGKKIGVVFGEVENEYNGKTSMRHEMRWFCEYDKAADAKIPSQKLLPNSPHAAGAPDDFMAIPDGSDEEVPF